LQPWHDEPHVFEVGVHLARPFWSQRLGEEATRAAMRYGFDELNARALTAGHGLGNVQSRSMIERLGF
jgi:ribosomal-protein-alanine N-acetyltransferase